MNKILKLGVLLGAMLVAFCFPAHTQQAKKAPRIGFLTISAVSPRNEAVRQGLRELGYMEGKMLRFRGLTGIVALVD